MSKREEKKYNFREGIYTQKEWVEKYSDRVEEAPENWYSLMDRTTYNRMDGNEQKEYENRLKEKAKKMAYRAYRRGDETFYTISKTTYIWAKSLKQQ